MKAYCFTIFTGTKKTKSLEDYIKRHWAYFFTEREGTSVSVEAKKATVHLTRRYTVLVEDLKCIRDNYPGCLEADEESIKFLEG